MSDKAFAENQPAWDRAGSSTDMAMNLRLSDAESEALRAKADEEGRSMQEVAESDRPVRVRARARRGP